MAKERHYNSGSILFFERDVGDEIYVLKSGRIDITFQDPQTSEKITKTLNQGEFFGLKSAIINHTRDEMAESVTDSIVIVFSTTEFETFVSKKVDLMKRLLQVSSNQLRNLGFKVNNYLGEHVIHPPHIGLFKIGEYYLNIKKFKQAIQVYERYLSVYPDSDLSPEAQNRINIAKEAQSKGYLQQFTPIEKLLKSNTIPLSEQKSQTTASSSDDIPKINSQLGLKEFMESYYKAESFYNSQEYEKSAIEFSRLFKIPSKIVSQDLKNKALLMFLDTLFMLGKYEEASKAVTNFVSAIKDPTLGKKALFILFKIQKELTNFSEARQVLDRIIALRPFDQLTKQAQEEIIKLQMEV